MSEEVVDLLDLKDTAATYKGSIRVAASLRGFREQFGYSRNDVASAAGVDVSTISRIENAKRPCRGLLLAKILLGYESLIKHTSPRWKGKYYRWVFDSFLPAYLESEAARASRSGTPSVLASIPKRRGEE